jgi:hypothetical protein
LIANDWRLKPLHKLLVMSRAYQMSSVPTAVAAERDPANDLLSHFELRRLEAEEVRDSILAVSGNLNLKMFGRSIYPTIAREVLAGQSRPGQGWEYSPPEEQARRSVYIHIKRSLTVPLLAVFDANDVDSSCPVRYATTQPTQSLTMLNSEFLASQAAILARNLERQVSAEPGEGGRRFGGGCARPRHSARSHRGRSGTRRGPHRTIAAAPRADSRARGDEVLPDGDEFERIPVRRLMKHGRCGRSVGAAARPTQR